MTHTHDASRACARPWSSVNTSTGTDTQCTNAHSRNNSKVLCNSIFAQTFTDSPIHRNMAATIFTNSPTHRFTKIWQPPFSRVHRFNDSPKYGSHHFHEFTDSPIHRNMAASIFTSSPIHRFTEIWEPPCARIHWFIDSPSREGVCDSVVFRSSRRPPSHPSGRALPEVLGPSQISPYDLFGSV